MQYQILQIDIIRIVWQTVKRITNEILGVKGFTPQHQHVYSLPFPLYIFLLILTRRIRLKLKSLFF